jgi:hypothetical protein
MNYATNFFKFINKTSKIIFKKINKIKFPFKSGFYMVTQHINIYGIEINMKIMVAIDICKFNIFQIYIYIYFINKYLILNIWL